MSTKHSREKSHDGRDGWEEDEVDEHRKPKRLEEAIVSYLTDLESQMDNMSDEDAESKAVFVENVLTEIRQSTASAACDRRTNSAIERICYNASLENVIEILARFTNYAVFLARNRHASHVVQALLARLCSILKFSGIGDVDENTLTGTVLQFVRPILKEITWLIKEQAASHVIRSILCLLSGVPIIAEKKGKTSKHPHSVAFSETLENVCDKKYFYIAKDVTFNVPEDFHEALGLAVLSIVQLPVADLQDLVAEWSSCAVFGVIIRIMSNPSIVMGGPELALRLIRATLEWNDDNLDQSGSVFYAMAGDRTGSYFLEAVIECCEIPFLLTIIKAAILGRCEEYSKDACANFVLQTVLKKLSSHLSVSTGDHTESADHDSFGNNNHNHHNHHDIKSVQKVARHLLKELSSRGRFEALMKSKAGIVLWMLDLAKYTTMKKKNEKKQSSSMTAHDDENGDKDDVNNHEDGRTASQLAIMNQTEDNERDSHGWSRILGDAVLKYWNDDNTVDVDKDYDGVKKDDKDINYHESDNGAYIAIGRTLSHLLERQANNEPHVDTENENEEVQARALKDKLLKTRHNINASTRGKLGSMDPVKEKLDSSKAILTGRLVNALMHGNVPNIQETLAKAITTLSSNSFVEIATSGPLSRYILDPYFEYCSQPAYIPSNTRDTTPAEAGGQMVMRSALAANWLSKLSEDDIVLVGCHYIGQHSFRRAYEACVDVNTRESFVKSLNSQREKVNKCKEGRASMKACQGDLYKKKYEEWLSTAKRQEKARQMLISLTVDEDRKQPTATNNENGPSVTKSSKHNSTNHAKSKSFEEKYERTNHKRMSSQDIDSSGPAKKKKKRSGNNASREAWFRENRDRLKSRAQSGTTGTASDRNAGGDYKRKDFRGTKRGRSHAQDTTGADFTKIASLKSAKLNLNLSTVVAELANK